MIFSLFHGQSSVERGFSINADTIDNNMEERTIVARRTVHDAVQSLLHHKSVDDSKGVAHMEKFIDKEMFKYCRSARNRYRIFLEEKKSSVKNKKGCDSKEVGDRNVALLEAEHNKLDTLEKDINKIENEANDLALKAERQNKLSFVVESNLKRKRVTELKSEATLVRSKILKLENTVATG